MIKLGHIAIFSTSIFLHIPPMHAAIGNQAPSESVETYLNNNALYKSWIQCLGIAPLVYLWTMNSETFFTTFSEKFLQNKNPQQLIAHIKKMYSQQATAEIKAMPKEYHIPLPPPPPPIIADHLSVDQKSTTIADALKLRRKALRESSCDDNKETALQKNNARFATKPNMEEFTPEIIIPQIDMNNVLQQIKAGIKLKKTPPPQPAHNHETPISMFNIDMITKAQALNQEKTESSADFAAVDTDNEFDWEA